MLAGQISDTGPGIRIVLRCEIMSSEFRHVFYRINIGSQLSPSSINLLPVQAGKVTVASHWPCVTDHLRAHGLIREMSTPRTLQFEYGTLYLYLCALACSVRAG